MTTSAHPLLRHPPRPAAAAGGSGQPPGSPSSGGWHHPWQACAPAHLLLIYGSRVRGEGKPSSDLDVLVSPLDDGQDAYLDVQVVQHLLKPRWLPETSPLRAVPLDVHLDT